jgi:2-keto-4-pentenoate hydratase/2-oxohepta-3-ene-1,7-dioic acid hydratase in catechol pathway
MKLATIEKGSNDAHITVVIGDNELLDLITLGSVVPEAKGIPAEMCDLLAGGDAALAAVRKCIDRVEAMTPGEQDGLRQSNIMQAWDDVSFLPPMPNPAMVLSVGLNYRRHLEEMENTPVPANPAAFVKNSASLTGAGKPIIAPPQCPDMIDFEGEFSFVFGRECHNVSEDEALDYVAGYTIANDVSARDWVGAIFAAEKPFEAIAAWDRNILGKQLPTFCPCGPVIVTKDEIVDPHDLQLTTTLNGEVMQSTKTDDLVFNLPQIISYFSFWYRFRPGDIVTTGSPAGVGVGRKPPVFMKPGDVVEIEVEGIGTLSNPIIAG